MAQVHECGRDGRTATEKVEASRENGSCGPNHSAEEGSWRDK